MSRDDAGTLLRHGMATSTNVLPDWWDRPRRDLRLHDATLIGPIVACLNIWNDTKALKDTLPSWIGQMDALVVMDGPYALTGKTGPSDDGLEEFLDTLPVPVYRNTLEPDQCWIDQAKKRTQLLQEAAKRFPDATLVVIDADEFVEGDLRSLPVLDVGWVTMRNASLYERRYGQPRLIKARPDLHYDQRHHWLYAGDHLLATHQYGGAGFLHRAVPVCLTNARGLHQDETRQAVKSRFLAIQHEVERSQTTGATASDRLSGRREALHILQLTTYDPAFVAGRLHTAINATTPHASILATDSRNSPYSAPCQYDIGHDRGLIGQAWDEADVVHCHLTYHQLRDLGKRPQDKAWRVIHHHGTMYRKHPGPDYFNAVDPAFAGLRLVSNLELLQYGTGLRWLPNPMPCAEYRRLRVGYQPGPVFRVAHSPSKRHLKGTEEFLSAIATLQVKGLPVEAVLIEQQTFAESVRVKSQCDAVFDSFWLGIQCSGLEGAAMGLPVIAGDPHVAQMYRDVVGEVPYTFANEEAELVSAVERLVLDQDFRATEAARVSTYCERFHDEAAVALRYLDLLDDAFHWRVGMSARFQPKTIAPAPAVQAPPTPRTPEPAAVTAPEPVPLLTRSA